MDFAVELDALIAKAKVHALDLGEVHADLIGAAQGLSDELDAADED